MNVLELSPRDFSGYLREMQSMGTPPEQIANLQRAYRDANTGFGLLAAARDDERALAQEGRAPLMGGLLSIPQEDARQGLIPQIGGLLSGGARNVEYEGVMPMVRSMAAGTARAANAPASAAMGLVPREDMIGEAMGTAGLAMGGGGVVASKPSGALGVNSIRSVVEKYPDVEIDIYGSPDRGYELSKIKVPESSQGSGVGSQVMDEIISAADAEGARITLTPDTSFGGSSVSRLKDFYKRFGFVENKGRNKDFSTRNTMYRDPVMANASKSAGLLSVAADVADQGDLVLNMLKSGRGSDVTDDMLDMGDSVKNTQLNQYLFENYDLPMDEASRMARAREMGFEGGLLHGTGSDITAVDPAKLGGKQNVLGRGFYQTSNPERSDRYVPRVTDEDGNRVFAERGNVMPLMTKSADEFDLTVPTGEENITRIANAFEGSDYDVDLRGGGDSVSIKSKTDPKMSVFLDSYQDGQATLMRLKDAFGRNNLTPILQEAGFTGVKGAEGSGSNVRVNYNPEDVRSQFARFDPRLSRLSNLNAANASPLGGLLAPSGMSEEQQRRIERYLSERGLLQ